MINTMHSYGVFTIWYPVFTDSLLKYSRPIPENKAEDKKDENAECTLPESKKEEQDVKKEQQSTPIKRESHNSSPASNADSKKSTSTVSTTPSRKPLGNTEGSSSSNVSDISVESH